MTIPFQNLRITMSDIRLHIKWAVSLVIAYGHFNVDAIFRSVYTCSFGVLPLIYSVDIAGLYLPRSVLPSKSYSNGLVCVV